MIPIKDLINKIKYDAREKPGEYVFYYYDRIQEGLKELKFFDIKRMEGNFLVVDRGSKEVEIPMHRIRKVKRKGKVVWERMQ